MAYISIHSAHEIIADAGGTTGAPVSIRVRSNGTLRDEVTLFTDSLPLSRRIADAINEAVKPPTLTAAQCGTVANLVDVLWDDLCSLDDAKTVLRAAIDEYENRLEAAWQHRQEDGGSDDGAYRRDMIDAGRGHLVRS